MATPVPGAVTVVPLGLLNCAARATAPSCAPVKPMTQNAQKLSWTAEEVDQRLHQIMQNIHAQCVKFGTQPDGYVNYVRGANVAGFMKVARAMMAQGIL